MEILWKGTVSAPNGNSAFLKNSHTKKKGEITVFYGVQSSKSRPTIVENSVSFKKENQSSLDLKDVSVL